MPFQHIANESCDLTGTCRRLRRRSVRTAGLRAAGPRCVTPANDNPAGTPLPRGVDLWLAMRRDLRGTSRARAAAQRRAPAVRAR